MSDDLSRRSHLQQYAPHDFWERVMAYVKANLHKFVPKPEMAQNSDSIHHTEWMTAIKELAPQDYQTLLQQWRVTHQRRRNLWKAMTNLGLR